MGTLSLEKARAIEHEFLVQEPFWSTSLIVHSPDHVTLLLENFSEEAVILVSGSIANGGGRIITANGVYGDRIQWIEEYDQPPGRTWSVATPAELIARDIALHLAWEVVAFTQMLDSRQALLSTWNGILRQMAEELCDRNGIPYSVETGELSFSFSQPAGYLSGHVYRDHLVDLHLGLPPDVASKVIALVVKQLKRRS